MAWRVPSLQSKKLTRRYQKIFPSIILAALAWWGVLLLIPGFFKLFGYSTEHFEGTVGVAPPAAYYTDINKGIARNQFLFERPISLGFFLVAFWPLFFILCFKNKPRGERLLRGSLYGLAIMSTFSRAARAVWILQTAILIFAQFPRKYRKFALRGFVPLILLFGVVIYFGQRQIISREFSNTGHFNMVVEAIQKIGDRPLRGQGA